jgi:hypothetical protein
MADPEQVNDGHLRLLLSVPESSAGRAMPDGLRPRPGGRSRVHLVVEDLDEPDALSVAADWMGRQRALWGRLFHPSGKTRLFRSAST